MALKSKKANKDFYDLRKIEVIHIENMGDPGRAHLKKLLLAVDKGQAVLKAVYDNDFFVGYYCVFVYDNYALLYLCNTTKMLEETDYKQRIIKLAFREYKNYQVISVLEKDLDDEVKKEKYLEGIDELFALGFKHTNCFNHFNGLEYEIFCNKDEFDYDNSCLAIKQLFQTKEFVDIQPKDLVKYQ